MTKTIGIVTALAIAFGSASAAFACEGNWCGGYGGGKGGNTYTYTTTTNVAVSNSASVSNSVSAYASTGGNDANGGSATGKNAHGGTGGTIETGNAAAASLIANDVNSTDIEVVAPENCGCVAGEHESDGKKKRRSSTKKTVETELNVALDNSASVSNSVDVKAKTGYNDANGGSATSNNEGYRGKWGGKKGKSEAHGGHGGMISTGDAESSSGIVNLINAVILRVL